MTERLFRNAVHTVPSFESEGVKPFFQPAQAQQGECAGWLQDMESLTKRAAEHYVSDALGVSGVAKHLKVENNGKWYVWTVETDTETMEVRVSVAKLKLSGSILVKRHNPMDQLCEYSLHCDPVLRFTRIQCKT